jgi:hypothetical protein
MRWHLQAGASEPLVSSQKKQLAIPELLVKTINPVYLAMGWSPLKRDKIFH